MMERLKEGAIVLGYYGHEPVWCYVLDRTPRYVRLVELRSVTVSYNVHNKQGTRMPVQYDAVWFWYAKPFIVRVMLDAEGNEYCNVKGEPFHIWDGKPAPFQEPLRQKYDW